MKSENKKGSARVEWNPEEVLKVDEVALLLRMKPDAIYNGIKNGVIPALKIGNRLRLSKRAVLEALDVKRVGKERMRRMRGGSRNDKGSDLCEGIYNRQGAGR